MQVYWDLRNTTGWWLSALTKYASYVKSDSILFACACVCARACVPSIPSWICSIFLGPTLSNELNKIKLFGMGLYNIGIDLGIMILPFQKIIF